MLTPVTVKTPVPVPLPPSGFVAVTLRAPVVAPAAIVMLAVSDVALVYEVEFTVIGRGRPAYVRADWAVLDEAVAWITGSGGVAVLAHPARYPISGRQMRSLLTAFHQAGGVGIEVATGNVTRDQMHRFAELARQFDLLASAGSDFHDPAQSWIDLGRFPELPAGLVPVWQDRLRGYR